jgi:hypothetical protein
MYSINVDLIKIDWYKLFFDTYKDATLSTQENIVF